MQRKSWGISVFLTSTGRHNLALRLNRAECWNLFKTTFLHQLPAKQPGGTNTLDLAVLTREVYIVGRVSCCQWTSCVNELPLQRAEHHTMEKKTNIRAMKKSTIVIQRQADLGKRVPPDTVSGRRFFMHVSVNKHAFQRYQQNITIVLNRGGEIFSQQNNHAPLSAINMYGTCIQTAGEWVI